MVQLGLVTTEGVHGYDPLDHEFIGIGVPVRDQLALSWSYALTLIGQREESIPEVPNGTSAG